MPKPIIDIDWSEGKNSQAFADYVAAFHRLVAGRPEHHGPFVAIVEDGGRVNVNQLNVALESGHPRSRISGDGDFKKLGATIKGFRSTHGVSDRTLDKLRLKSEEIAFLSQRVKVFQSKLAASVLTIDRLRREAQERDDEIARLRRPA